MAVEEKRDISSWLRKGSHEGMFVRSIRLILKWTCTGYPALSGGMKIVETLKYVLTIICSWINCRSHKHWVLTASVPVWRVSRSVIRRPDNHYRRQWRLRLDTLQSQDSFVCISWSHFSTERKAFSWGDSIEKVWIMRRGLLLRPLVCLSLIDPLFLDICSLYLSIFWYDLSPTF